MLVAFDAKRAFNNHSGLGNYSRDVISLLAENYPDSFFLAFTPAIKNDLAWFIKKHKNVEVVTPRSYKNNSISGALWRSTVRPYKKIPAPKLYHGLSNELPLFTKRSFKMVVTIHDLIFLRFPSFYPLLDRTIYKVKVKRAVKRATVVIATSVQTKNDLIELLNVPEEKIVVQYQSCHEAFKQAYTLEVKELTRSKLNLPPQFLLYVGTIEERKNLLTLIKALPNINLPLVIVGKKRKEYFAIIQKEINLLGLNTQVHFLENVTTEELAHIYQMAAVMALPSLYEGFGIPLVEALYSKTPIVTNKEGVFKEVSADENSLCNVEDVDELTSTVLKQLQPEAKEYYHSDAYFQHLKQFENKTIAEKLMNVYKVL